MIISTTIMTGLLTQNRGDGSNVRYAVKKIGGVMFRRGGILCVVFFLALLVYLSAGMKDNPPNGLLAKADSEKLPSQEGFEVLGIGGGGGMFTPAPSPYDKGLILVSCDMGGSYRSTDGGNSWEMIHWREISNSRSCQPYFVPGEIYWATGSSLRVSRDKAKTWNPVVADKTPWGSEQIRVISASVKDGTVRSLFVGTARGLWRSADVGRMWREKREGRCDSILTLEGRVYAVVDGTFLASSDDGASWEAIDIPQAEKNNFVDITGGSAESRTVLYGLVNRIGVLKSTDGGKTWLKIYDFPGWTEIAMAVNQTEVVYAALTRLPNTSNIYRSTDGGTTWKPTIRMTGRPNVERSWLQKRGWGYYITDLGFAVNPSDAKNVMFTTQCDFYVSHDSGESWKNVINTPLGVREGDPGYHYKGRGLEVTTTYYYLFDPFERNRTYICYTDVGFARSIDRGETWTPYNRGNPWGNTLYRMIFDPRNKGRLYAAASSRHDIPQWTHVSPNTPRHTGGVIVSDDFGITWRVFGKELPRLPATWIEMDPETANKPDSERIFYVTLFGGGVWKSTDGGATWGNRSKGLGNPGNLHTLMVKVHPKTGNIYASITARREGHTFPVAGGIWKSSDGGDNWADITSSVSLKWPGHFVIHPENPEIIYLTAATIPGSNEGGVYKTTNGGRSWTRLLKDEDFAVTGGQGYVHALYINMHPDNPDLLFVGTTTHGLWITTDAGKSWNRIESIPFKSCNNVTFDPEDPKIFYVATFGGGVWRGDLTAFLHPNQTESPSGD
jgi:photosystem II stability/assembly factor-like uncharacterized protein